ncbi:2-hydroxychromene-2-carboxylate isomerase [Pikeienuella piscinae]|uniref:2-hydroxychromene-2-carboxylate isomerase n=1 Tax=Pikeienuella piscinae TaxID=2748098 RepID=A0A7L5BTP4_9RHOB|nr:2-hydroxychromene-2-carboxylate isomerase [Pikeienuella piscinae]QIE55480.1 2-hydroxychromene-2-carboxylate isomerase [Pikeienuella piscinae]
MAHIDYYFTPLSPFAYLAGDGLERIAAKHGATIAYKPIDFGRAIAAAGGLPVAQRPPARQEYRLQELPRIAKRAGLSLTLHPAHWPTDGTPACAAILAAEAIAGASGGDVGALARRILAACWAEEQDIAAPAVIDAALRASGFDPVALDREAGAARIGPLTDEAIERGVFGAPFYIVAESGQKFWGQDRLDYLDAHLAGEF